MEFWQIVILAWFLYPVLLFKFWYISMVPVAGGFILYQRFKRPSYLIVGILIPITISFLITLIGLLSSGPVN